MTYDVVVAGGGPAGLGAARAAAEAGASVLVLERESAFGIPTRTSGASFVASLEALGIPSRLWSPISEVRFLGPGSLAVFAFDTPVVCVLDVRALYQWLAEQAAAAGAELRLRSTVAGAADDGAGVTLTVRSPGGGTTVRGRWCVDATGTAAVVSGAVGMHPAYVRRGVGAEVDLAAPAFPADRLVLAVGERLAPAGYAWAFPWREGRVRLGVGVMRPDSRVDPRDLLEAARRLPGLEGWLEGAQPVEVHAGLIPAEPLRTRIHRSRVVCAGDSASHASTLAGEGIRYALAAGAGAGAAVAAALSTGTDGPVRDHERSWRRRHGRDFAIAYRLNTLLAGFDDRRWDRAVATLARTPAWFAAAALSTDFSPRLLLRLAAGHPRLALTLLRAAR